MRELNVLIPSLQPVTPDNPWREAFFFLVSFVTVLMGSVVMLEHAAAVLV